MLKGWSHKMGNHVSVLLDESIEMLGIKPDGIYVDMTLGRGGHSSKILEKLTTGHLYCFDLDEEAIKESRERLEKISSSFTIIHDNFKSAKEDLLNLGVKEVDGIIMDLGVSSPQFDEAERGFSYRYDAPLDMRMDQNQRKSAKTIVNEYDFETLLKVFREYGEDRYSYQIASAIVKERAKKEIATTSELVEIIKRNKPAKELAKKGHPAKQIFQALRIETNDEMKNLEEALDKMPSLLKKGGVYSIITFHSIEDRIVKEKFRLLTKENISRTDPSSLYAESHIDFVSVTKKPIVPSEEEMEANNRAHSAKLRGIKRKE